MARLAPKCRRCRRDLLFRGAELVCLPCGARQSASGMVEWGPADDEAPSQG